MYNFYVEEDAHLVVNDLTAGKKAVLCLPIAFRIFDFAVTPVLRPLFKFPVVLSG